MKQRCINIVNNITIKIIESITEIIFGILVILTYIINAKYVR